MIDSFNGEDGNSCTSNGNENTPTVSEMAENFMEGFEEVITNFSEDVTKVITESVKILVDKHAHIIQLSWPNMPYLIFGWQAVFTLRHNSMYSQL